MVLIPQRSERYLRSPRLVPTEDGGATLHLIAWEGGEERIIGYPMTASGEVGEPEVTAGPFAGVPTYASDLPIRESADPAEELRAVDQDAEVGVDHRDGISEVHLRLGETKHLVTRLRGIVAAPAVLRTEAGAWVAYHHDVREDDLTPDVAKWIALRFVDEDGEVFEPAAPRPDRDRERAEVEQSFEFPALARGDDGAVTIFGRGSHNFWRQDLGSAGFGERVALSDGQWGSRGRRITACRVVDGDLLIAMRDRKGVVVETQPLPEGGPPALRPARVDQVKEQAHVITPSWERERDPARAHGLFTFFGDIQQHSAHSDGIGTADEAYLRARHRYGDDFVALTDHESFLGKRTGPGEWTYLQDVADRHQEEGAFATLIAYEWTGKMYPGPGHKCVYFPDRDAPLISRDELPEGRELVQAIKETSGFASPHHIGWTGCDEEGHDPVGQPVWEICSCHGCYEHPDHPLGQRGEHVDQMVDAMLRKGHRFGFTAASDSHGLLWHHGECRKRDPYRTGLTGVQASELSRRAVFEAIRDRRCFATSGAKIRLDVRADGAPMGSELPELRTRRVEVHAIGEGAVDRVELVGPNGVIAGADGKGDEAHLALDAKARYLYARIIQKDGEMAWSSPIFMG